MAFELVEEVLDHAPADLTPTERLVLIVIAEQARKESRLARIPSADFLRRTGVQESGLRKAFRRLAERGIDPRVALYTGKDGRLLYSAKGSIPHYRLPIFGTPEQCSCHRCTKAVPQDLHRKVEVLQDSNKIPQDPLKPKSGGPPGPNEGPPGPPLPSLEKRTVLSQDRPPRVDRNGEPHPYDRQLLMDQLAEARRKRRGRRSQPS